MSIQSSLPGSGISINTATWRDLKALYHMERVCFQLDAWPMLDILGVLTIPQVIRLKAETQDELIGFIAADLRRSQQTAWIATLAVLPEYRNSGIASELLGTCEELVTLPRIRLSVRQSNQPAIQLYQKYGYQQVEIWKKYYKGGDNALVFEKKLSATSQDSHIQKPITKPEDNNIPDLEG
ncbi:MAG: GNAT family N-acetyltransferase [Anaerolineales bacterium]|nr:GNAT family N-acetyltransferase [Anaerolineales bacterium]